MLRSPRVTLLVAIGGVLVVCCAAAAAAGIVISGFTVTKVPGSSRVAHFDLERLACPPVGACVAEGEEGDHVTIVMSVSRSGRPGRVKTVPNSGGAGGIACPSANFCLATAYTRAPAGGGVLIPIRSGTPRAAQYFAHTSLGSISCGSRTSCWVFGGELRRQFVMHILSGRIVHKYIVHGVQGDASCVSASRCFALGAARGELQVLTLDRGRVTSASDRTTPWPPWLDTYTHIACEVASDCVVTGYGLNQNTGKELGAVVATVTDGSVGPAQRIQGISAITGVTCSSTACFALAWNGPLGYQHTVLLPIVNRSVGDPIPSSSRAGAPESCDLHHCLGFGNGATVSRFTYSTT